MGEKNLMAEICTGKANFRPIQRLEVKLTTFRHVINDAERRTLLRVYHRVS